MSDLVVIKNGAEPRDEIVYHECKGDDSLCGWYAKDSDEYLPRWIVEKAGGRLCSQCAPMVRRREFLADQRVELGDA